MPRDRRTAPKAVNIDSFIDGGGSPPQERQQEADEMKTFTTRFPKRLVDMIDEILENQMFSESRNQWLMKAAVEKLRRENS